MKMVRNTEKSKFKSLAVSLVSIVAVTFLAPELVFAEARVHLLQSQKQIAMLTESGKSMVMHINQAAESRTKAEIQEHAKEAIRFGEEVLAEGQQAMSFLEQAAQGPDATAEIRKAASRSMEHLEMTLMHVGDALYLARASLGFKSFQNLLGGIQESATHARHAGLHILSEEHARMEMEQ